MDYRQLLSIMLEETTQEDLAEELETTQATISRWLKGQEPRGAALERIRRLARQKRLANDATIEAGFAPERGHSEGRGRRRTVTDDLRHLADQTQARLAGKAASGTAGSGARAASLPLPRGGSHGDIANFTIHAGMGNGGTISVQLNENGETIDPSDSDGYWSFPEGVKAGWRHMGETYAMPVTGDSMEPTLQNGAYVFVDTSHTYPSPPDLYALNYGHGLMIKRLELLPDEQIRVISDNDRYTDFEFSTQDVEVYGRVVASFQFR